jgi:hypothetical protein
MTISQFRRKVLLRGGMLAPLIVASIKDTLWCSLFAIVIVAYIASEQLLVKIFVSIIIIVLLNLIYFPMLLFLLLKKYKKNGIPCYILREATFREKENFISEQLSWL